MQVLITTSTMIAAGPMDRLYSLIAGGVLLLALSVALKAWFHDRAKGLPRCRKCWYPLPPDELRPCPECGYQPRLHKDLYHTRRSKRWLLAALLLVVLSGSVWYWPHVQYRRSALGEPSIRAIVPTTYLIWVLPYSDESEWIGVYDRVSGKGSTGGLFGTSSQSQSVISANLLGLNPDPVHIGYVQIDPEYEYQPNSLFFSGPYIPEQMVWRWQGRFLLDRLLKVANDQERELTERLGAFHLYTGYCGYTRQEHFDRVLPLMSGEHGDKFVQANDRSPSWGPDGLDPHTHSDQLAELAVASNEELLNEMSIIDALAITGNPAMQVIDDLWSSDDHRLIARGTQLMEALTDAISESVFGRNRLDRDRLDVDRYVALLGRAIAEPDLKIDLFTVSMWALQCWNLAETNYSYEPDHERAAVVKDPDSFFYDFIDALTLLVVKKSNEAESRFNADEDNSLLLILGSVEDLTFEQHGPILKSYEQLLDSQNPGIQSSAFDPHFELVYEATSPDGDRRLSLKQLNEIEKRVKNAMRILDENNFARDQGEWLLEMIAEHRSEKNNDR